MKGGNSTKFVMIAIAAFGGMALVGRILTHPLGLTTQDASFLETVIGSAMTGLLGILARAPQSEEPVAVTVKDQPVKVEEAEPDSEPQTRRRSR